MITIKYEKTCPASLLSHVDTLRSLQRIFRRADIETNYSQGFNPHMLLFMSPPLSLGIASRCEYVTADVTKTAPDILAKFNEFAPEGIRGTEIFITDRSPNLAGKITKAEYEMKCAGLGKALEKLALGTNYFIKYPEKGETTEKDVRNMIYSVETTDENIVRVLLACGNFNLKADRLLRYWCGEYGLGYGNAEIVKTAVFCGDVPADEFIASFENK